MKTSLKEIYDIVLAVVFIYLEVSFERNLVLQSVLISSNWSGMECEKTLLAQECLFPGNIQTYMV